MTTTTPTPVLARGRLYLAHDRVSVSCAGMTALFTGVTIGGAPVVPVVAGDVTGWAGYGLGPLRREGGHLEEGVSTRVWFGHLNPVVHLVTERGELWCTGGRGRRASIGMHARTGGGRHCRACTALAQAAIADQTLDGRDVPRFLP